MKIFKKASVFLFTLCAIFILTAIPAAAEEGVLIDPLLILSTEANLTVVVDGKINVVLSDKYAYGEVVSLSAPSVAGKTFHYWTNGSGDVISYTNSLSLTMYADTTVKAEYGSSGVQAQPATAFLNVTRNSEAIIFNAVATAPSGGTVTEAGIRYSTTKNTLEGLKGNSGVTVEKAPANVTNWTLEVTPANENTVYYAVSYVTAGGQTRYSAVKTVKFSELENGVSYVANLGDVKLPRKTGDSLISVTFEPNGSKDTVKKQALVKGQGTALGANTFTREGYAFTGWNTKANGTGTAYADKQTVTLSADMTLYAQWREPKAVVTTTPTGNPSTYNGKAAPLISEGTASGGTMQYALGTDAKNPPTTGWSTAIPTASNAGTYYVWYKAVSEGSNADSEPVCIVVEIAKTSQTAPSAPVVTAATPDSLTVKTVRGVEFSIDGEHWQTSGTFTGLKPDTTYIIQARKAETTNHNASHATKVVVNTPAAQTQTGGTWRLGLRILNVLNIVNSARQTATMWNPWSVRTIWTPWWLRR